jgi:hypothetical protein
MGGPCSTNGEKRNAYRLLMGKPEGKNNYNIINLVAFIEKQQH